MKMWLKFGENKNSIERKSDFRMGKNLAQFYSTDTTTPRREIDNNLALVGNANRSVEIDA